MDYPTLEAIPSILETQAGRELTEGSVVVVDCVEATYRLLNDSGSFLWSLIDGQRSVQDLQEALARHYDIQPEQAHQDLINFLQEMKIKGMVTWSIPSIH